MPMMYIVDRRLIERFGRGITDDDYHAIPHLGPVPYWVFLSWVFRDDAWKQFLIRDGHEVLLATSALSGALSQVEQGVVDAVAADYGALGWSEFHEKLFAEAPEGRVDGPRDFTLADVLVAIGEDAEAAGAEFLEFDSWRRVKYAS
jgi:hypothetical protein